ncbi:MAG: efflux RND transporter periplasmic adaptor subunit [Alphaproteobacteria bacterium]|nr:efflux RND transporter periplasmic adaptor subunit [Alphaproteobacteria bacterium]
MPRRHSLTIVVLLAIAATPAHAADVLWAAKAQTMPLQVVGYATVEPRSVLRLRAGVAGTIANLTAQPGDPVGANAVLGQLTGPSIDTLLAARRAAVTTADAAFKAAQQELAIERQKFAARLSTRGTVARAVAAMSNAQADRDSAHAALAAAEDMASIRAPQAGRVLTVDAYAGQRISADETVLTLLPENDLWLRATIYGTDADSVSAGATGQFVPAGGGATIPVKVRAVVGALRPDGGRTLNLVSVATAPGWLDGETGTVTLDAGTFSGVAVPTRALILDQTKWWVLVHTPKGDVPQEVALGPSRGGLTLITAGLAPGSAVVVEGAYLEFHRGISERYQPPD